jgi:signal transduction histidine kinase
MVEHNVGATSQSNWQPKRQPAAPAAERSTDFLLRDLQSLLSAVVLSLRETTDCESAFAWALREDGAPYVAAADFAGDPPVAPDAGAFAALAALRGATDLNADRGPTALREIAARHRCSAAAPIAASGARATAVLLTGERNEVRPRTLAALDAAAKRLAGPVGAALALGRLRRLDEEIRRLDRLAALGSLATEIVHEVRNPLVSVKTFLQLLPEYRDDPEFLTRFFDVVSDEFRRMERLLDLVIEHARPQSPEPSRSSAPVAAVLDFAMDLLRHRALKRGVVLETDASADLPPVAMSEDALRQVVLNLALNAIDATPDGRAVHLRGRAAGASIELIVSDEGPGVPAELRSTVFEPYTSTRRDRPGGLGLAITRRIVEEANGTIGVADGESVSASPVTKK